MRCKEIISPSNPVVKEALKIKERRADRRSDFLVEGKHILEMALESGVEIKRVFVTRPFTSKNEGFLRRVSKKGGELIETTERILSILSDTETPQGVAAVVSYESYDIAGVSLSENPLIMICDGIQDPGNLGTIIRTSDAAGADAVILLPGTCDFLSPKVVRASAGSVFNIPVFSAGTEDVIKQLKERSVSVVISDAKASKSIYEADLGKPVAFALGNEARGVSKGLRAKGDLLLKIPIIGFAESLNVAASAAVFLYETIRQRTLPS
jgi:TrmH family RNA methyltransferase